MGDLGGLVESMKEMKLDGKSEMIARIQEGESSRRPLPTPNTGQFTLRDMYEQYQTIMQMGPVSKIMSMLPGMSADMFSGGSEEDVQKSFKTMLCIMDSMNAKGCFCF